MLDMPDGVHVRELGSKLDTSLDILHLSLCERNLWCVFFTIFILRANAHLLDSVEEFSLLDYQSLRLARL